MIPTLIPSPIDSYNFILSLKDTYHLLRAVWEHNEKTRVSISETFNYSDLSQLTSFTQTGLTT